MTFCSPSAAITCNKIIFLSRKFCTFLCYHVFRLVFDLQVSKFVNRFIGILFVLESLSHQTGPGLTLWAIEYLSKNNSGE